MSEHSDWRGRAAPGRGRIVRTWPTSSVRLDGLVKRQSKSKASVMEILICAQWVEAECDTGADLSLRLFLAPGQHSTPREGKEGAGVVAPLFPSCRQIKQLFR
jgi:hypothetical protein